jgi:hypothetical protein
MKAAQLKTEIKLIKIIDWLLVFALVGYLVYAYLQTISPNIILTVAILGLFCIHQFGKWSISKVAELEQNVKQLERTPHVR